ncbi:MAG: hypothetical protein Q9169_001255 [Polycauliona sp. 2 TL-2023]
MSLSYILSSLYSQLFVTPPVPNTSFHGQTVIVTGSNTGLGLDAARHITRLGASKVIIAVRNTEKGLTAQKSIEEPMERREEGAIEVWPLDLTSYESVKQFAARAMGLERLDVLLSNAGLMDKEFKMAEEDELNVTTNVTSTFLLAMMLLPKMRETGQRFNVVPRSVIVSSDLHFMTELEERKGDKIFERLNERRGADMNKRYAVTKLMEILIVRELAARIDQSTKPNVIVNCLTPGLCHSDFGRNSKGMDLLIFKTAKFFLARTTEVGSRTLVAAASAGEESHGKYMADSKVSHPEGEKTQRRLWEELDEFNGVVSSLGKAASGNHVSVKTCKEDGAWNTGTPQIARRYTNFGEVARAHEIEEVVPSRILEYQIKTTSTRRQTRDCLRLVENRCANPTPRSETASSPPINQPLSSLLLASSSSPYLNHDHTSSSNDYGNDLTAFSTPLSSTVLHLVPITSLSFPPHCFVCYFVTTLLRVHSSPITQQHHDSAPSDCFNLRIRAIRPYICLADQAFNKFTIPSTAAFASDDRRHLLLTRTIGQDPRRTSTSTQDSPKNALGCWSHSTAFFFSQLAASLNPTACHQRPVLRKSLPPPDNHDYTKQ